MAVPHDPGVLSVAAEFGVSADDLLGHGGEAWVYALGDDRILRVLHGGGTADELGRRHRLVAELRRAGPAFALPDVLEIGEIAGRVFAIERRLPGRSLQDTLPSCSAGGRQDLIEAYLDTTAALGDLLLAPRHSFGDLIHDEPIVSPTWRGYLAERAAANLARSTGDLRSIDPAGLVDGLPDAVEPSFVHLDAFAGNVLTDGTAITAVLDIGATSVAGDRRFDPLSAVVYLTSSEITPVANAADIDVAMSWLRAAALDDWFEPVRRWLAAYWSFAVDSPLLLQWCRRVLGEGG